MKVFCPGFLLLFVLVMMVSRCVYADTVILKNGRKIEGIVKAEDDGMIGLEVCAGVVKFKKSEIERIEKSKPHEHDLIRADWEIQKRKTEERISRQRQEELKRPQGVEFSRDSLNIRLRVKLNRKVDVQLVMDTGSTLVVLKKEIAEQLKINLEGAGPEIKLILADGRQTKAKLITLESVEVEGVEAKNVESAIMLDDITDPDFKDGLLGMSFLKRFNFKIDNREKKLILERL
jgi:clan AA aspartic protease (TIGR02281 family)